MLREDPHEVTCHCFFCKCCFIAYMSSAFPSLLFPNTATTVLMAQELVRDNQSNNQDNSKIFSAFAQVWLMHLRISRDQITDYTVYKTPFSLTIPPKLILPKDLGREFSDLPSFTHPQQEIQQLFVVCLQNIQAICRQRNRHKDKKNTIHFTCPLTFSPAFKRGQGCYSWQI